MTSKKEFLTENPRFIGTLESIVEYEREHKTPESPHVEDTEYDSCWSYSDVGEKPQELYQLEKAGFLDRVFDTNSSTVYSLRERDKVSSIISEFSKKYDGNKKVVEHEYPTKEDLDEMEIFEDVVGYEDVKWLLKKAIANESIVNILLIGPPGSGKTIFLRAIRRLDGAAFISGKRTSEAGFTDKMFEEEPRFMCIDELDDMDNSHQEALSDYTEEGIIVETKGNNKRREMETNTKTFAAANSEGDIIDQINDRFTELHFDEYELWQFQQVCENILPRDYDVSELQAKEIANAVWEIEEHANVRKAEDVAALSDGGNPRKVLSVLDNYSEEARL